MSDDRSDLALDLGAAQAAWSELFEARFPLANVDGLTGPFVVLQVHLDGSRWLLAPSGATVLVTERFCHLVDPAREHEVLRPHNPYGLTGPQTRVLLALVEAGDGLVDDDLVRIAGLTLARVETARRILVDRGLVIARFKVTRFTRGESLAQVWDPTMAGRDVLRPTSPPGIARLRQLARAG